MKIIVFTLLLSSIIYSQQQIDIPWPTLAKTDWPMVKHDPQFTGRSPFRGPQTPTVAWTKDMQDGIFSGPVIGDSGNIYFGSYYVASDKFYCFDHNGQQRWVFDTNTSRPPQSGILIDSSNTIYFGGRDKYFYALNPDGTLKWRYQTSGEIVSNVTPNIDLQGNIYITNFIYNPNDPNKGELYSFKRNGTVNWHIMIDNGFAFRSPVFSPDGETIYIAGVDSNLFALNLDGSIKWKFSCGRIVQAPMVDSDGNIYFIPNQDPQYIFSLKPDGSVRWQFLFLQGGSIDLYSTPTIDREGNIYSIIIDSTCCPTYYALISLRYDGALRWKHIFNYVEGDDFTQPLICDADGTVYVGSTMGYYYYAISSEGELKWKLPLTFIFQQVDNTGAIAKDGTLYLGVHDISLRTGQFQTLIAINDSGATYVEKEEIPEDYFLSQNYPNPFNPTTKINYSIKESGHVTLKVYDILGREVAVLVNENKPAGSYTVEFNAANLPSGVYIYKLTAGKFTAVKKLILMK